MGFSKVWKICAIGGHQYRVMVGAGHTLNTASARYDGGMMRVAPGFGLLCLISSIFLTAPSFCGAADLVPKNECDALAAHPADPGRKADGVPLNKIDAPRAVAACRAAVSQYPDAVRLHFQLGRAYHSGNNYDLAISEYRKVAEQGDARGQYNLGYMYENGQGVEKSAVQAVAWYRKAAEQGNALAQYNLGVMYANGQGVEKDAVQAVSWYRKAAEQGEALAQYNLGVMYENGQGVGKDIVQAVSWYRKAAEQGDDAAAKTVTRLNLRQQYASGKKPVLTFDEAKTATGIDDKDFANLFDPMAIPQGQMKWMAGNLDEIFDDKSFTIRFGGRGDIAYAKIKIIGFLSAGKTKILYGTNFKIGKSVQIIGRRIGVEKYRTRAGYERHMGVFEADYIAPYPESIAPLDPAAASAKSIVVCTTEATAKEASFIEVFSRFTPVQKDYTDIGHFMHGKPVSASVDEFIARTPECSKTSVDNLANMVTTIDVNSENIPFRGMELVASPLEYVVGPAANRTTTPPYPKDLYDHKSLDYYRLSTNGRAYIYSTTSLTAVREHLLIEIRLRSN